MLEFLDLFLLKFCELENFFVFFFNFGEFTLLNDSLFYFNIKRLLLNKLLQLKDVLSLNISVEFVDLNKVIVINFELELFQNLNSQTPS
jgi:hypothetical protein